MRTLCCEWEANDRRLVDCELSAYGSGMTCELWYGVVSSRLGRPVEAWRSWFHALDKIAQMACRDGAAIVTAERTTAAPWVQELANLHRLRWVTLRLTDESRRDEAVVMSVNRVLVPWLRRGGNCDRWLRKRLSIDPSSVWISLDTVERELALELLSLGAVGWRSGKFTTSKVQDSPRYGMERDQIFSNEEPILVPSILGQFVTCDNLGVCKTGAGDDQWLTHCTRARQGPLPRQSEQSWRREVLLGGERGQPWTALEVLIQILRSRRLLASPLRKDAPPSISFTEMSPFEAAQHRVFRPHRCRWDFEPYGIAIRKETARALGAMPVIYSDRVDTRRVLQADKWRMQPRGHTYDWTQEREWRLPSDLDLSQLSRNDLAIFVSSIEDIPKVVPFSTWPVVLLPT